MVNTESQTEQLGKQAVDVDEAAGARVTRY